MTILKTVMLSLATSSLAYAQEFKTISGYVLDGTFGNEPIESAIVYVNNTEYRVETDTQGFFSLKVPADCYKLSAFTEGYKTADLLIEENEKPITFVLDIDETNLEEIVIDVSRSKSAENVLLDVQRKSLELKQEIGAEELEKKGVSDAATAVAKTAGVSKQESTGGIFVRGLGDRYNSTYLNNLPLVSNDPEKKNIDLQLFATDIIEKVSIDKAYFSRNMGDFGGASVSIHSKKNQDASSFSVQIGSNVNTNALSVSNFEIPMGRSYTGFATNDEVPTNSATTFFFTTPYNTKKVMPIGSNLSLQAEHSWKLGLGKLSLLALAGFENNYKYKEGIDKQVNAQGVKLNDYFAKHNSYNTQGNIMVSLDYSINDKNNIFYNFLGINDSQNVHSQYRGYIRDKAETDNGGLLQRNVFLQNLLQNHQMIGGHKVSDRQTVDWGISLSKVESNMPDRIQSSTKYNEENHTYSFITNSASDNHRYSHKLIENQTAVNISTTYNFAELEDNVYKGTLTLGYNGLFKDRDFKANQYNFHIANHQRNVSINPFDLNSFFNAENHANGYFTFATFRGTGSAEPQFYKGNMNIHAGFVNVGYNFFDKFSAIVGVRLEKISQQIEWKTQLDNNGNKSTLNKNAILPNLHLKYAISAIQNLRVAASKTYTLPQFKERAPFIYEDVTEIKFGNKDLYASDNYNLDLKWEIFPTKDEIVSATVFGKYIKNPINETNIASATNDISFINTGNFGYVTGVELELRKDLWYESENINNKLSFGTNISYMKTHQELNSEKIQKETNFSGNFTHKSSKFTGASDLLLNADLTYIKKFNNEKSILTTVAYNYNSDRIYALGVEQKGNLVDKGFGTLDFVLKSQLSKNISLAFTAKNILNPTIKRVQENLDRDIIVKNYKLGTQIGLSLKYQL